MQTIVDEMHKNDMDLITYTFWNKGQMCRRFENINIIHDADIDWFEHTVINNPIVQKNENGSYLISHASIMKTTLFKKVLFEKERFRWSKEVTFDFEIEPGDIQWHPLKGAIPQIRDLFFD